MDYEVKLLEHKDKILQHINKGKEVGINKVSAIMAMESSFKENLENDLVKWLVEGGYKVSLKEEEFKILVIEWESKQ